MEERRRILLAAGKKAVYIFKNGDSALRIGAPHTPFGKIVFQNGCIQMGSGSGIGNHYLINIDFTDFSKLHFVVSTGSYGSSNYLAHHANYSDAYNKWSVKKTIGKNAGKAEYVFDISSYSGIRHLCIYTANMTVYDIWLD